MHKTVRASSCTVAVFIAAALTCQAQHRFPPFYIKGGVGPSLVQDADLKSFPGSAGKHEIQFDPGVRFDIGFGFRVTDWFAAEFETGMAYNEIDSIAGAANEDARIANVPFMGNAVFQCPHWGRFVPYIGVGAGFSSTVLDVDEITIGSVTVFGGSESDVVFAYQGFAGFRYLVNDQWSIGASYKYMGTEEASWKVRSAFFGGSSQRIRLDNLHTHSVTVDFTFNF